MVKSFHLKRYIFLNAFLGFRPCALVRAKPIIIDWDLKIMLPYLHLNTSTPSNSGCVSKASMGSTEPMEFWRRVPEPMDFEKIVKQCKKTNFSKKVAKMRNTLHFFLFWAHIHQSSLKIYTFEPMDLKSQHRHWTIVTWITDICISSLCHEILVQMLNAIPCHK